MKDEILKSINRANALLKNQVDSENLIIIKLSPSSGCCCSHCWPKTWQKINYTIAPNGPIQHEGDALVVIDGNEFVVEQHESGPEILVQLALVTASATLLKSIIDLIATIIKSFSSENRKPHSKIKISRRQLIKGKKEEETIIEIEIPIPKDVEKKLEEQIKTAIIKAP